MLINREGPTETGGRLRNGLEPKVDMGWMRSGGSHLTGIGIAMNCPENKGGAPCMDPTERKNWVWSLKNITQKK